MPEINRNSVLICQTPLTEKNTRIHHFLMDMFRETKSKSFLEEEPKDEENRQDKKQNELLPGYPDSDLWHPWSACPGLCPGPPPRNLRWWWSWWTTLPDQSSCGGAWSSQRTRRSGCLRTCPGCPWRPCLRPRKVWNFPSCLPSPLSGSAGPLLQGSCCG